MALVVASLAASADGQIRVVDEVALTGTVETVVKDGITVRSPDGTRHEVRVQGPGQQGVALSDGKLLSAPAKATGRWTPPTC